MRQWRCLRRNAKVPEHDAKPAFAKVDELAAPAVQHHIGAVAVGMDKTGSDTCLKIRLIWRAKPGERGAGNLLFRRRHQAQQAGIIEMPGDARQVPDGRVGQPKFGFG